MREEFHILVNEGFSSNQIDESQFQQSLVKILFQYPSVSLTKSAFELANIIPQFSNVVDFSLRINQCCFILQSGYQKLFESISQLINLRRISITIGSYCSFGKSEVYLLKNSLYKLENLEEITLRFDQGNYLEQFSLFLQESLNYTLKLTIKIDLDSQGMKFLLEGISKMVKLEELLLKLYFGQVDDQSITSSFCEALKNLTSIVNLSLCFYQTNYNFGMLSQIARMINLSKLCFLLTPEYKMTNLDIQEFVESVSSLINLKEITLKGIVSENLQIENSFSNVLKNLTLLENCEIDIKNIQRVNKYFSKQLGISLENLNNLRVFSLLLSDRSCIDEIGSSQIANGVSKMINLESLTIYIAANNTIGQLGIESFGNALKQITHLKTFNFVLNKNNEINEEGVIAFCDGLKSLIHLMDLKIESIANKKSGACKFGKHFGNALKAILNLQKLHLRLNYYEMPINEEIFIGKGIGKLINLESIILHLDIIEHSNQQPHSIWNNIACLIKLKDVNVYLFSQYNYQLPLFESIIPYEIQYLINLDSLELSIYLDTVYSYALEALGIGLQKMKNLQKLTLLIFNSYPYDLSLYTFKALGQGLSSLKSLEEMSLSLFLSINTEQSINFENIFKNLTNLKILSFSQYNTSEETLQDIAKGFKYLNNLISLDFTIDLNTESRVELFGQMISQLQKLKSLDLNIDWNVSSDTRQLQFIQQAFKSLQNLNYVQINDYPFYNQSNLNFNSKFNNIVNYSKDYSKESLFLLQTDQICKQNVVHLQNIKLQQNNILNEITSDQNDQNQQIQNILTSFQIEINQNNEDFISYLALQESYDYLQKLVIEFNQKSEISENEVLLFQKFLSNLKNLKQLKIECHSTIKLRESTMKAIENSLKILNQIENLNLTIFQDNYDRMTSIANGIRNQQHLKELQLSVTNFNQQDWSLFQIEETFSKLTELTILHLKTGDIHFSKVEIIHFSKGLKNMTRLIDLSIELGKSNNIQNIGANAIGESISHLVYLQKIHIQIDRNNKIGSEGAFSILGVSTYIKHLSQLKKYSVHIKQRNDLASYVLFQLILSLQHAQLLLENISLTLNFDSENQQLSTSQGFISLYEYLNISNRINILMKEEDEENVIIIFTGFQSVNIFEYDFKFGYRQCQNNCFDFLLSDQQQMNSPIEFLQVVFEQFNHNIDTNFEINMLKLINLRELKINLAISANLGYLHIGTGNYFSQLNSLKKLTINFIQGQKIIEIAKNMEQLDNLEYLNIYFYKRDNIELLDISLALKSLQKLTHLKYVVLLFEQGYNQEIKYILRNTILLKIKRLVNFSLEFNVKDQKKEQYQCFQQPYS